MKQILIQKLRNKISNDKKTEIRINELKNQLNNIQEDYQKRVYFILKEIIDLRKTQIKKYSTGSLSREKGIKLTSHQIIYIFNYQYISDYSHSRIDAGQLRVSTILFIIKQDLKFREAQHQNKVVKMYLGGKLKTTEISRMSKAIFFDNVNYEKEIEKANKQVILISYSIQEYMKTIKSKQNLFSDRKTINYIINQIDRFKNLLEHTLKFGDKLK